MPKINITEHHHASAPPASQAGAQVSDTAWVCERCSYYREATYAPSPNLLDLCSECGGQVPPLEFNQGAALPAKVEKQMNTKMPAAVSQIPQQPMQQLFVPSPLFVAMPLPQQFVPPRPQVAGMPMFPSFAPPQSLTAISTDFRFLVNRWLYFLREQIDKKLDDVRRCPWQGRPDWGRELLAEVEGDLRDFRRCAFGKLTDIFALIAETLLGAGDAGAAEATLQKARSLLGYSGFVPRLTLPAEPVPCPDLEAAILHGTAEAGPPKLLDSQTVLGWFSEVTVLEDSRVSSLLSVYGMELAEAIGPIVDKLLPAVNAVRNGHTNGILELVGDVFDDLSDAADGIGLPIAEFYRELAFRYQDSGDHPKALAMADEACTLNSDARFREQIEYLVQAQHAALIVVNRENTGPTKEAP